MRRTILFAALAAMAVLGATGASAGPFDSWSYRMKIRFAGYNPPGGGSLTNFPALVTFRNGSNAFHYADMASPSDAADLRFATATGADELTYEVDRWDTGGVSTVWVRTDLAGTNDCLWAYWGKSGATLPPYTTNGTTWSAGYRCVWHLGESPADAAPQLQDRTATRLHASCLGGMVAGDQVAGQIGGALRFDGTARYAETATNDLLDSDQAGTVSAWVKTVANGVILAYGNCQVQSNAQWIFEIYTGALRVAWSANPQGKNASVAGRIPVANGVWHHVAASADGVNPIALYVDGVADTTTFRLNAGDPGATNWDWIADCYGIAARSNYVDLAGLRWQPSGFYGRLAATVDEVRVSSVVRSSNWVWACWLNQASNRVFADYANAQSAPDVNNAGGASDLQATSATLNASLAAGSSAHGYLYCWTNGAPLTNAYDMGTVFEGTFSTNATELARGSAYFYRAYVTNDFGEAWSAVASFTTALATTYYVSPAGNDANSGLSWALAKKTINAAANAATTNTDVVVVTNGLYTLTATVTNAAGITIRSVNGPAVTLVNGNSRGCFSVLGIPGGVLDGLTLSNGCAVGGGVKIATNCTVQNCVIKRCFTPYHVNDCASAVYVLSGAATLRNCLIAGNDSATIEGGSAVWVAGGATTIEGCTITGNRGFINYPGGIYRKGGTVAVINSIVWNNVSSDVEQKNYSGSSIAFTNCCTWPLPSGGSGSVAADPRFVNPGLDWGLNHVEGDYRLDLTSPCIDSGTAWADAATNDLAGAPRPADGNGDGSAQRDMGAYELPPYDAGALRCGVLPGKAQGFCPCDVVFSVTNLSGANRNPVGYAWDFGDGHTASGADLRTVTNQYSSPYYGRVSVALDNGSEVTTNVSILLLYPGTNTYVSPSGSNTPPFDTWAKAATTIQRGIDFAIVEGSTGSAVVVADGVYAPSHAVCLDKGITVAGANGATGTTLNAKGHRGVHVSGYGYTAEGPRATLDGLTITNGCAAGNQGSTFVGGGVLVTTNCTIRNCVLRGNITPYHQGAGGAAVHVAGGASTMENCLVVGNDAAVSGTEGGSAVWVAGGSLGITHCTVSGNRGYSTYPGGLYRAGGTVAVVNSIVFNNVDGGSVANNYSGTMSFTNSCTTPAPGSGANNITSDPLVVNAGSGYGLSHAGWDYHLQALSPCVEAGTTAVATASDIERRPRPTDGNGDGRAGYDMGAYQAPDTGGGPLSFAVVASPLTGFAPLDVTLSITNVAGGNTNIVRYWWNFGDGQTVEGTNLAQTTHPYGPFSGRAALCASNSAGQVATNSSQDLLYAAPTSYVALAGSNIAPYDTWVKAATTIQAALDASVADGERASVIVVGDGTFTPASQLNVAKPVTLRGLHGATGTVINAGGHRGVYVSGYACDPVSTGAVLEGLTVSNGAALGGGLMIETNCLLRSCVVTRCRTPYHLGESASGIWIKSGRVRLQNCLVFANDSAITGTEGGSAVGVWGGAVTIEDSTITKNKGWGAQAGGIRANAGSVNVVNSIVYDNVDGGDNHTNYSGTIAFTNACTYPMPGSGSGNIVSDPQFVLAGAGYGSANGGGDYRLMADSRCVNAGNNALVPPDVALDLDGKPRIARGRVDLGAYENQTIVGTVMLVR